MSEDESKRLPTAREINPFDDLDGRIAEKHYLGKTSEQAIAMIESSPAYYAGDYMWMGPKAFAYYLPAAIAVAHKTVGIEFLSAIICAIESHVEDGNVLQDAKKDIVRLCELAVRQYDLHEDSVRGYEDIPERIGRIVAAVAKE